MISVSKVITIFKSTFKSISIDVHIIYISLSYIIIYLFSYLYIYRYLSIFRHMGMGSRTPRRFYHSCPAAQRLPATWVQQLAGWSKFLRIPYIPWENSRENHGLKHLENMGKYSTWQNHGKTIEKCWEMWENHGKHMGKSWEIPAQNGGFNLVRKSSTWDIFSQPPLITRGYIIFITQSFLHLLGLPHYWLIIGKIW